MQPIFKETAVSTNRNLSLLPTDFPQTITVKVQEGEHLRQRQLWAPLVHAGKHYKLILNARRLEPVAGEEWEVYPEHSPNGHIVFCQVSCRLKTASGEHPFVERTAPHVKNGWVVHIHQRGSLMNWGNLKEVKVEGEMLSIKFVHWDKPHIFTCPVGEMQEWRSRSPGSNRFGYDCYVGGKKYQVVFLDDTE